uniref:Uncharacterized protein n=1 Tax=Physcomitrium patens TaxID=3218 RepID=A0A2K1JLN6_PHYPA|nr:hypothetical protein PHYPA_017288 [Physcomitrium patens]
MATMHMWEKDGAKKGKRRGHGDDDGDDNRRPGRPEKGGTKPKKQYQKSRWSTLFRTPLFQPT